MAFKLNASTGKLDRVDSIRNANSTTYFTFDGETVSLYVNGVVRQTWTTIVQLYYLLLESDTSGTDGILLESDTGGTDLLALEA